MALADHFQEIVDSLPSDWTDLELDLRVQEDRYVQAATLVVTCNALPYSNHVWHWKLLVAHQFGHAAAAPAVHGTLRLLDEMGIRGELKLRDYRTGRPHICVVSTRPVRHSRRTSSPSMPASSSSLSVPCTVGAAAAWPKRWATSRR